MLEFLLQRKNYPTLSQQAVLIWGGEREKPDPLGLWGLAGGLPCCLGSKGKEEWGKYYNQFLKLSDCIQVKDQLSFDSHLAAVLAASIREATEVGCMIPPSPPNVHLSQGVVLLPRPDAPLSAEKEHKAMGSHGCEPAPRVSVQL